MSNNPDRYSFFLKMVSVPVVGGAVGTSVGMSVVGGATVGGSVVPPCEPSIRSRTAIKYIMNIVYRVIKDLTKLA